MMAVDSVADFLSVIDFFNFFSDVFARAARAGTHCG